MRARTNKKYIAIVLMAMLTAGVQPAPAQGFFNKLKNKAKEVLDNVTHVENNASANGKNKPTAGESNKNSGGQGKVPEHDTPVGVENLHMGTSHVKVSNNQYTPKVTSSTKYLTVNGSINDYHNFFDGVAYINSYEDGIYYIDMQGNKLFDSRIDKSVQNLVPRFNNGVVMEYVAREHRAYIRDKKGNTIKDIPVYSACNFEEGIAAVSFKKNATSLKDNDTWTIKYIDVKGNYVFPKLWFTSTEFYSANLEQNNFVRKTSEGMKAYAVYDDKKSCFLWGFHDGKGNVVIAPKYLEVSDFHDGMAAVCCAPIDKGKGAQKRWGYIDKTGREVIPAKYSIKPSDFDSGLARVITRDENAYIIDKAGNQVFGPVGPASRQSDADETYDYISPFYNGMAIMEYSVNTLAGYKKRFVCTVDTNFKKLAWTLLEDNPSMDKTYDPVKRNSSLEYVYYSREDNTCYIRHSLDYWKIIDMKTLDEKPASMIFRYPIVNGLSVYSDAGGNRGYVDINGNFVIKVKQNEF